MDGDKLDGQHGAYYLDWRNFTNKPSSFPPSGHGHSEYARWDGPNVFLSGQLSSSASNPYFGLAGLGNRSYFEKVSGVTRINVGFGDSFTIMTGGSERLNITANGAIRLNDLTIPHLMQFDGGVGGYHMFANMNASPRGFRWFTGSNGNDLSMTLATNGTLTVTGGVVAQTVQAISSDARLKEDIEDLRHCVAKVLELRPRTWRWKQSRECDFGFIAQEYRDAVPQAVHEGDDGMLYVRYGKAEALIVGAVQELVRRLEALTARVDAIAGSRA